MSASSDLQTAIANLLTGHVQTLGDGVATFFEVEHGLGSTAVAVAIIEVGVPVAPARWDYTVDDANTITIAVAYDPPAANAWRVTVTMLTAVVPVIARVSKSLENDIAAAVANDGLAISVMPMMPDKCDPDFPFVFITGGSIRVRIIEKVQVNKSTVDAYQLRDEVMTLLHYRPRDGNDTPAAALGAMLSDPLRLGNPPAQMMFESGTERVIDVIFNAVLQINEP